MKTKESIAKYNKEYFSRPEVIARAKIRNAQYRKRRQEYKKTKKGKEAEKRYQTKPKTKDQKEWNRKKNRYGITKEEYFKLIDLQNGCCGICGIKKEKLEIDHCHTTGKIRGLLCGSCNRALGLLKDNIDYLVNSIKYLQK